MGCSGTSEEKIEKNILINTGLEKSIVFFKNKGSKSLGFLCKINFRDSKDYVAALITTTDSIGKIELEEAKQIYFFTEDSVHSIRMVRQRGTYINEDRFNVVIIQIVEEDNLNINSLFEIEENDIISQNSFIGVINKNNEEKNLEYFICKINTTKNDLPYIMEYTCKNKEVNESKGNPLINIKNNKLIAIQKNSGLAVLLKEPIKELLDIIERKEIIIPPLIPLEKIDENKFNKRLSIFYLIPDNPKVKVMKIFGEKFVENNRDKCKIIFEVRENEAEYIYELCAFIDLDFIKSKKYVMPEAPVFLLFLVYTDNFCDLSFMFFKCYYLFVVESSENSSLDQVTDMKQMFDSCRKLDKVEININTSKVTDMSLIFYNCLLIEVLDLSGWNTKNVTTMKNMFRGCENLEEIIGLDNWDLSN